MLATVQLLTARVVEATGDAQRSVYARIAEGTYNQIAATVRGIRSDQAVSNVHALV